MQSLEPIEIGTGHVQGRCHKDWHGIVEVFAENFRSRNERGASLCVRVEGRPVVDVWGGVGGRRGAPWREGDVSVVFSATKGATALCAHVLASRGDLDLDAPVTRYWPEFGKGGKEAATVAMLLDHSAGVPGFREPVPQGAFADWDYMVRRIEDEEAWWAPGSQIGYHLINFGWTVGEVVRRVSGRTLGQFFASEIAGPLGLDFWIGLPPAQEPNVVDMEPYIPGEFWTLVDDPLPKLVMEQPESLAARAMMHMGGYVDYDATTGMLGVDSGQMHAAEIGGAGGITNARGLAGMYDPLANGGGALVSPTHLSRMSRVSMISHKDPILQIPTRFGPGFMKAMDNRHLWGDEFQTLLIGERAFGHVGAGGSLGFADPDCSLAFGYTMNRMGPGSLLNPRGQALVNAVYRQLGYQSSDTGVWA